jgi:hypothetical protein
METPCSLARASVAPNISTGKKLPTLRGQLDLSRCPHCSVDSPTLLHLSNHATNSVSGNNPRVWATYACARCGGAVVAAANDMNQAVLEYYPSGTSVDDAIPDRARAYLVQALDSMSAPSGAVMLAASAVDAMLKAKELKAGNLYSRIDQAAATGLITGDMAKWAHDIRLDANDERHADDATALPSTEDAKRAVDFALALGQFMFVLPARVNRGIKAAGDTSH